MSMWRRLEKNLIYEFVLASQAVSRKSYSSYLDGFSDGR